MSTSLVDECYRRAGEARRSAEIASMTESPRLGHQPFSSMTNRFVQSLRCPLTIRRQFDILAEKSRRLASRAADQLRDNQQDKTLAIRVQ